MSKTPLLLLHGALGSSAQWESLSRPLSGSFEIHTFDFSGHGSKPLQGTFSMPTFALEVEKYLTEHKIANANIFGYSMGGYVALYLASQKPDLVRTIFTLGTKFLWTSDYAVQETGKLDAEKILAKVPAFAAELEKRHTASNWKEVLTNTRAMMLALGNRNLLTPDVLDKIQQPVRIGIGDRDNTVSVKEAAEVVNALSNAQLEVFPNTPHPLERVSPERLAFSIKEFFRH
jgi:pimeloyl-ACP methyl ester carboxylesterase